MLVNHGPLLALDALLFADTVIIDTCSYLSATGRKTGA